MSEWNKFRIDEIGEVITGSTPSTKNSDYWKGTIPFYSPADFRDQVYCNKTEKNVSEQALSISRSIPENAIMFTCIASIGKMAISQNIGITNQQINTLIPKANNFDYKFLYYILFLYRNLFIQLAPQTTIPIINKTDFSSFSFNIPASLSEQRKIARILSTVDAVIEKTEAAIAKYKAIKSGMMRDLFTRGIDIKTGKLRPSYEDAPELYKESKLGWIPKEWEVVSIGKSCVSFINGGTPSTKNTDNWKGTIPWVTGADFLESFEIGFIRRYINQDAVSNSSTHVINGGNILLVTRTGVGKLAIAPFDIAISQDITGLILDKEMFRVNYFFIYLQLLVEDFKKMNQGTSINGIVRHDLENTLIIQPCIEEQENVAQKVFSLARMIADENDGLHKYQQLKAALMSDLLTGKVRVKYNEEEHTNEIN
jgi:type I restriction enzyme S subunit